MSLDHWHVLHSPPGLPAWNMALDEALLEAMPRLNQPVLRFYSWLEPAASFGYFQKFHDVERLTPLRPLVRRPTGGGLVPHDYDWTYSVAIPPSHPWYSLPATESYQRAHDWLRLAFACLGILTELAPTALKSQPGQCFIGHERSDLLWQGRKIAGAAQRRRRDGLLIQGSIQPPPSFPRRVVLEEAVRLSAEERFGISWTELQPDPVLSDRAQLLARQKYSDPAYNQNR